jgi:hypothetical protein
MRDKLDSLGFLDHRCMPVVDEIDSVMGLVPTRGPYNGSIFHSLFKLGMLLSDPDKIKRHGSGLLQPVVDLDPEPEDYISDDDQVMPEPDSKLTDEDLIQPSLPEVVLPSGDAALVEEPMSESEIDDDDDIPGFDDYLAKHQAAKGILDTQPAVHTNAASGLDEGIIETPKAMEVIAPVKSVIEDDLDNDDDETSEPEKLAIAEDFWF